MTCLIATAPWRPDEADQLSVAAGRAALGRRTREERCHRFPHGSGGHGAPDGIAAVAAVVGLRICPRDGRQGEKGTPLGASTCV